jgi:hypothetical protein
MDNGGRKGVASMLGDARRPRARPRNPPQCCSWRRAIAPRPAALAAYDSLQEQVFSALKSDRDSIPVKVTDFIGFERCQT